MPRASRLPPVEDLALRFSSRDALETLNNYCLADLSAISEEELLKLRTIGIKTLSRQPGTTEGRASQQDCHEDRFAKTVRAGATTAAAWKPTTLRWATYVKTLPASRLYWT